MLIGIDMLMKKIWLVVNILIKENNNKVIPGLEVLKGIEGLADIREIKDIGDL